MTKYIMSGEELEAVFWNGVAIKDKDDCWEWQLSKSPQGYGNFYLGWRHGMSLGAHRCAYEFAFGIIPEGLLVCHRCDNRMCCNPKHLFLGTHKDNADDRSRKGRGAMGERGTSKLTAEQVREIRKRYASGTESQTKLAIEYGVTQPQIWQIVSGNQWKHLLV